VIVPVYRRPRVAILATGDELVEPGTSPSSSQIINCNSFAVAAALKEIGAEPVILGIARDNRESHLQKISEGLKADALITSAGVSAGDRDLVRDILEELGVEPVFWKIDIKPGRPTAFATFGSKPIFSLPGNPVSTMITFEEFVKPALLKMMGHTSVLQPTVRATLRDGIKKKSGRTQFMRVHVTIENGRYTATTSGDQNTGILKTMIRANGLAILPAPPDHIQAGEQVDVQLIGSTYA
jgi:molybdopterin molybdotransferase